MNRTFRSTPRLAALCGVLIAATVAAPARGAESSLDTDAQRVDYGLGVEVGRNFRNQGIEPDVELVIRGLRDALAGRQLAVPEKELRRVMMQFRTDLRRQRLVDTRLSGEANRAEGVAFLAANATKPDVVSMPSGLQYRVLKQGSGPVPGKTDVVQVSYRGRLLDGTEFDSSARSGEPATFSVSGTIAGWRLALLQMPVGSKWELFVPPKLAYGARGTGLGVGPDATVVFELELLRILPRAESTAENGGSAPTEGAAHAE